MEQETYSLMNLVNKTGVSRNKLRYWLEMKYLTGYTKISNGVRSRYIFTNEHIQLVSAVKKYLQQGHSLGVSFDRVYRDMNHKD